MSDKKKRTDSFFCAGGRVEEEMGLRDAEEQLQMLRAMQSKAGQMGLFSDRLNSEVQAAEIFARRHRDVERHITSFSQEQQRFIQRLRQSGIRLPDSYQEHAEAVDKLAHLAMNVHEEALEIKPVLGSDEVKYAGGGNSENASTASGAADALSAGSARDDDMSVAAASFVSPPGAWMDLVAGVVFSRKTKERIFDQGLGDFREEYFEALQHRAGRARMFFVIARHWSGFILACLMEVATGVGKVWKKIRGAG